MTYYLMCPIILFCISTRDMESENWINETNQVISKFEEFGILHKLQVIIIESSDERSQTSINSLMEICIQYSIQTLFIKIADRQSNINNDMLQQLITYITLRKQTNLYRNLHDPASATSHSTHSRISSIKPEWTTKILPQFDVKRKSHEL